MGIKEVLGEEEGKGESTWNICSSSWRDKCSVELLYDNKKSRGIVKANNEEVQDDEIPEHIQVS